MSALENFAFCGIAALSLLLLYLEGKREQRKAGRTAHARFNTNYARKQAALATASQVVRRGHRR